jgi:predicted RND superfamily exporter protein
MDIEKKKVESEKVLSVVREDYNIKKKNFLEAKDKFEDLLQYKQKVKDQMLGFLQMYEVKKEATLLELSHQLQQSENFKNNHLF